MSRAGKSARKHLQPENGIPWMVWGLLIGWLAGAIDEIVEGVSMFRMMAGGVAGLLIGAVADNIRHWMRTRADSSKPPHKPPQR
jgi:uncharacterized membrane protein YeaQ/YmgE (transglycosylase-associated protein family)